MKPSIHKPTFPGCLKCDSGWHPCDWPECGWCCSDWEELCEDSTPCDCVTSKLGILLKNKAS